MGVSPVPGPTSLHVPVCAKDLLCTGGPLALWQAPIHQTSSALCVLGPFSHVFQLSSRQNPWAGQLRGRAGMKVRRRAWVLAHHVGKAGPQSEAHPHLGKCSLSFEKSRRLSRVTAGLWMGRPCWEVLCQAGTAPVLPGRAGARPTW